MNVELIVYKIVSKLEDAVKDRKAFLREFGVRVSTSRFREFDKHDFHTCLRILWLDDNLSLSDVERLFTNCEIDCNDDDVQELFDEQKRRI